MHFLYLFYLNSNYCKVHKKYYGVILLESYYILREFFAKLRLQRISIHKI